MKQENSIQEKTTDWRIVLGVLIGVPLILAFILNLWLGVFQESDNSEEIFRQLGVPAVDLLEKQGYMYGSLYFCRFRLAPESIASFSDALNSHETYTGRPQEPVSFKLKRDWWDMDQSLEGKGWDREAVHLWRADAQPDLFYGVVVQSE